MEVYSSSSVDAITTEGFTFPQSIKDACDEIHKACSGPGTNEKTLIRALSCRSSDDRALIALRYRKKYHQDLHSLIRKETSGDFEFLLHLIAMSMPEAEAFVLHYATQKFGTSEKLIYPILMGRTQKELEILKETYRETYQKELADTMDAELSGEFKKAIDAVLEYPPNEYEPSKHTQVMADEDADQLYNAGQAKLLGKDEGTFFRILLTSPNQHLDAVNRTYEQKYGNDLFVAIRKEFLFHRTSKKALLYHLGISLNKLETMTDHIEQTMKGLKTNEKDLSVSILRYQPHIEEIRALYQQKYNVSLKTRVAGVTSGDHQRLVLHMIDAASCDIIDQVTP